MTNSKPREFLKNLIKPFKFSSNKESNTEEDLKKIAAREQKKFSFDVLVAATKNFHQFYKLGEGGFGPVYKGILEDGREIAVKKLSLSSNQGITQFTNEAKLLAHVHHRNVVNLLGYCVHGEEKLLVYEYVVNESLDKVLFKPNRRGELDWKRRYVIISGVARGLLYLHEDSHIPIIHRDIKASNILLDDKWFPKIADFGMARLFPEDQTHVNTRVAGTNGYMAPEYVMHGHLSAKADVFSFGVVVLELISGQKNSSFNFDPNSQNLLDWAWKLHKKERSLEIIDPKLTTSSTTLDEEQIILCIHIGLLCVQGEPNLRPTMSRIVLMLSRKPNNMEEPTRPGYPGSRYRNPRKPAVPSSSSSSSSSSSTSSSTSSSSLTSSSTARASNSSSGTFDSTTVNTTTSTSRDHTSSMPDPNGKRPVEG